MDQSQPNIPFGLVYNILKCFNRRELCQLRNVNHRHYTVIENKFGTSPPYLVFHWQHISELSWKWRPGNQSEEMPIQVRKQLPTSKFVRFGSSNFLISSVSDLIVPLISHVWDNQQLIVDRAPNYIWNDDLTHMATTAKQLILDAKGIIPYLRQLTSGNSVYLELNACDDTVDDVQLPWRHILDFLFKPNALGFVIYTPKPSNHHRDQMLQFIEQVKQKFLDSPAPVDYFFEWNFNPNASNDDFIFDDFIVENQRTKQCLRFHSTANGLDLTVENLDQ